MKHGFIRLGAAVPAIRVGAPLYNKEEICRLMDEAYAAGVHVLVFPELSLTGATCGDLFFSEKLLCDTETALLAIAEHSAGMKMLTYVGAPVRYGNKLLNCAAAISDGQILALTAKKNLPAAGDLDQTRHFAPAPDGAAVVFLRELRYLISSDPVFCIEQPELRITARIGEDLSPCPEATVLAHLSAAAEIIGREDWRQTHLKALSGQGICAVVSAEPGETESTTDMVFGGHCIIAENGVIKGESLPFSAPFGTSSLTTAVVDVQHLCHDRMRTNTFPVVSDSVIAGFHLNGQETSLTGVIEPCPFLPADADGDARCARMLEIQARGLARRLSAAYASGAVIALSGGLDSTLALIVTVRAIDLLGWDRKKILSVTMPCFGTTGRTRGNAEELALQFGTDFRCVDIKEAVDLHFRDIGHDAADLSVVYENAQARERTQIIMDIANGTNGLVIGTGDLSELALGWATYNGDHMSNYGVNGGIPKTLVRHIVRYYADVCEKEGLTALASVLRDILATPVSPELLPPKDGDIAQRTEDIVGPYDLHDFFLYHYVRWGESPDKIRRAAISAFAGRFSEEVIDGWLKIFLRRFRTQQFKRSALPDGPKVGSIAFSPRGAWMMPSDAGEL